MRSAVLVALLASSSSLLSLSTLAACSFGGSDGSATPDGPSSPDGGADAPADAMIPTNARRISLRIPAGRATAPLTDFPVYVDLTSADLKARLGASAAQLSFTRADGTALAHEVQSWDAAAGHLRAWVKLPAIDSSSETRFELRYGNDSVKAPADPAGVWANGTKAVFHLEQEPVNDFSTVVNSATPGNPGTPSGLEANDLVNAQLGKGYGFDGGNEQLAFANPILGAGPSTISLWYNDTATGAARDQALIVLGNASPSQARWIYKEINVNKLPVGLQGDDWAKPTVTVTGFTLVHWVYDNQQSRLYVNGVEVADSPFAHAGPADTTGTSAVLANAPAGFGPNLGADATIDEVHLSDTVRSAAWIAAEFSNQKEPATFVVAGAPEDL